MFNLNTSANAAASSRARVSLAREGNEQLKRVSQVVLKVHWTRTLLGMFWTAGPVTMIGLFGGFYLAYGKPPPWQTLLYFFAFTLISALIALFAKLVYDLTHGHLQEQAQENLSLSVDRLADLILSVRDLIVASHEEETRYQEAALQLLRRIELTPDGVALAAQELTCSAELGQLLGRIETYRRAGLFSRVADLNREYQTKIDAALSKLARSSPEAASLLQERFTGQAPQLETGVPRDEYFIERVLAAVEEDKLLLMTLQDVEEMLILAFELLNGRKIPMLVFSYSGKWKLARALDALEEKRSHYRVLQASASNRIRALSGFLVETDEVIHEQLPYGLSGQELLDRLEPIFDELAEEILQLSRAVKQITPAKIKANAELAAERKKLLSQLTGKAEVLSQALGMYKDARLTIQHLGKAHAALIAASDHWNKIAEKSNSLTNPLRLGPWRKGLRINEKYLHLTDEQKIKVSNKLVDYFQRIKLKRKGDRFFSTGASGFSKELNYEKVRRLAIEIALILEPYTQLSLPFIQRALNATNAIYVGGLRPDMSAAEKVALGTVLAKETQQDLSQAAEHLAVALVKHYKVDLTPEAQDFLITHYNARPQMLEMLSNYEGNASNPVSFLSLRPPVIAAPKRNWYKALIEARKELF